MITFMRSSSRYTRRMAVVLVTLLFLMGLAAPARAEWEPGKHMLQAVARVMGGARAISNTTNYGYDSEISIMAAFLKPNATVAFNRPFQQGTRYAVIGGGDNDVDDLDIEIFDKNGTSVAKDTKTDASPVVFFTPSQTGTYTIRQHLYKAKVGCFCVVTVLRDGGFDVPVSNLTTATTRLLQGCQNVDKQVKQAVVFFDENNQWAIYGCILRQGQETTITNIRMGQGRRVALAAGDDNATDIDLYVKDKDGDFAGKDEDPDATPQAVFRTLRGMSYSMTVKNTAARGPTLILMGVLTIRD